MAKVCIRISFILCFILGFHYSYSQSIRQEVLALAHSYINVKETKENRGPEVDKIIRRCGYTPPIPWCSCLVYVIYDSCNLKTPSNPAYSPNWFTSNLTDNPLPADVVGIYFSAKGRIAHDGILDTIINKDFIYTSGNTNDYNVNEGDKVMTKRLPLTKNIYFSNWIKDKPSFHIVKPGDNLYRISLKYSTSVEAIKKVNNITNNYIRVGDKLYVPN